MWVYLLLVGVIMFVFILTGVYVVRTTHRFIKKKVNNKVLSWIISIIPLLLLILIIFIDMINVIVVYIHLIVIVFLTKIIFFIIKKLKKKEISEYTPLIVGVIIATVYLSYGYYLANHVEETDYVIYTEKDIEKDFRIVQVSDSHIGATMNGKEFSNYMEDINKLNPDIVVITGDFIDDDTIDSDLIDAASGLGSLKTKYGVYFVFGNHDKGYYNHEKEKRLRDELEKNRVIVLEDKSVDITNSIILIGRQDREVKNRMDAVSLTKDLDKNKYLIMLDHQPNDYDNEQKSEVDLVLSGHTHGGQLIPLGFFGILFGSNDKVYGMETRDKTTFIVNSGISDWAIKFKTGTKSEYGVIDIKAK